ncbi:MAG: hypothetical protein NC419_12580 [Muribaculaceae bacterium]|nr:hypothetical protein [Muribaculaceae bacterium]
MMMRRKKNRFLLFWWSLIPGAGQMYLGFMKMGVSLLVMGALGMMITGWLKIGILSFIPIVVWIYSFFHANNLGGLSDEEFYQVEDVYLFGLDGDNAENLKNSLVGKYRKAAALILILLGISMLWDVVCDILYKILGNELYNRYFRNFAWGVGDNVPRLIFGIVVIWFGLKLIQGKKEELDLLEQEEDKYHEKETGWATGIGQPPENVQTAGNMQEMDTASQTVENMQEMDTAGQAAEKMQETGQGQ